jgi:16S rRNA (guanine1516-N2)-methyltransferase
VASGERPIVECVDGRLEARWPLDRPGAGISVDFASIQLPGGPQSVRGMPLVRACGRDLAREGASLLDATAGLGYDAFLLTLAGFHVTAVERSNDVFRLLEDGVRRANVQRLVVRCADARTELDTVRPAVVYLDPMYPDKRRLSALPPKEMQIVRALVGEDLDSDELFARAVAVAQRVVVKRPLHARPMAEPHHSIGSKLVRFDVYMGRPASRPKPEDGVA